jgi:putative hemolysin
VNAADIAALLVVVALLVVQAFLAIAEVSLTRISKIKVITLEEEGHRGAHSLLQLVEHPERFLNSILLLVNVCQTVSAILVGFVADRLFGTIGVVIGALVNIILVFVLTEAAPKTWAIQHTEGAALMSAIPVRILASFPPLRLITRGLIGLANVILPGKGLRKGPFVTEEELLATVDVATEDLAIEREERALIHSIIEFGDTVVREVMVPRPDMVAIEASARIADAMEVAIAAGYSRIPVYEQNIDDIAGLVYAKDLMRALRERRDDHAVRELLREARYVPETKRVAQLMREMQAEKFHMAIVIDEYGGTAGLVTLEDLIEELVGEIVDEYDVEEPLVEPLPDGELRVNGRMPIDELNDLLHADLPAEDWDTVAGLVFNLLGHVPNEGESVVFDGFRFRAEKVQGRRIGRVRITPLRPVAELSRAESS